MFRFPFPRSFGCKTKKEFNPRISKKMKNNPRKKEEKLPRRSKKAWPPGIPTFLRKGLLGPASAMRIPIFYNKINDN